MITGANQAPVQNISSLAPSALDNRQSPEAKLQQTEQALKPAEEVNAPKVAKPEGEPGQLVDKKV